MVWGESLQLSAPHRHDRSNKMSKNKILEALSTRDRKLLLLLFIIVIWVESLSLHFNVVDAKCVLSRLVMSDSFVTPWTVAHQAPLSTGFLRQEC